MKCNSIQFLYCTQSKNTKVKGIRKEKGEKASIETIMIIMLVFHVIKINFVNKESHMTCNYHSFLGGMTARNEKERILSRFSCFSKYL